jgi:hypothetical protein
MFRKVNLDHRNKSGFCDLIKSTHCTIAPAIRHLELNFVRPNDESDGEEESVGEETADGIGEVSDEGKAIELKDDPEEYDIVPRPWDIHSISSPLTTLVSFNPNSH